jgi:hypothetical protein
MPERQNKKKIDDNPPNKKVSVLLSQDYIRKIEDAKLSQTEAIIKGLDILFSDDYQMIFSYKNTIQEHEKKIIELEAMVTGFETYRQLIEEQNKLNKAHISQVQTLLQTLENERRSREDVIRQKEEKILLLEGENKKRWWEKIFNKKINRG